MAMAVAVAMCWAPSMAQAASPSWSVALPHNSSAAQKNAMDGVSCASTTFCFAVGGYYTGTNPTIKHTQTQKWNGTSWSIVTSPNKTGSTVGSNYLMGVSCATTTFCMAAGFYTQSGGGNDQTLVEKWNGTAWSIVTSPNVASEANDLNAVSCFSTTFCMAVGEKRNSSFVGQTLIEKWNGTSWSIVTSPNTSTTQSNFLWGASCSTASFCMAVGYHDTSAGDLSLAEKWNGTTWSIVSSPNHSGGASNPFDALWSVSCVPNMTNFCMAAGDFPNASFTKQTLVEKWNGTAWSVVTSPNTTTTDNDAWYSGVSCPTTTFCMDSTFSSPNSGPGQTVILKWNGTALSIVPSADTSSSQDNELEATSCPSSLYCVAVGQYTPSASAPSQNLAEVWK
jgi:hypothetical protein